MRVSCFSSPAFHVLYPEGPCPLVLDSPHSGSEYPEDFGYACPMDALREAEDTWVDEIFADAPGWGAPLLCARFPRSYIDPNRCLTDIDPLLLETDKGGAAESSSRSAVGYGLIRRLVRPGLPVYGRKISDDEINNRINRFYAPYHEALSSLLDEAVFRFGSVWHLNCHSMPSPDRRGGPDIVLGDRDGTACGRDFLGMVRDSLIGMGYRVAINDPYKGVEILRRYGAPGAGRHSLQIELSKQLYMNEKTQERTEGFVRLKSDMTEMVRQCIDYVQSQGQALPLAAD